MSRALVEQFCQVSGLELKPEFFRRCQREFRDGILPLFDEVERLKAENVALQAKVDASKKAVKKEKVTA